MWMKNAVLILAHVVVIQAKRYSECSKNFEIMDDNGEISSPSYPDNYANHLDCRWRIIVSPSDVVKIQVKDLANAEVVRLITSTIIHCSDILNISQMSDGEAKEVTSICGQSIAELNETSFAIQNTTAALIEFRSDFEKTSKGFLIHFEVIRGCNQNIIGNNGTLESPRYPNNYPPNIKCTTTITTPEGTKIRIKFSKPFNIKMNNVTVCDDFVKVQERPHCGRIKPDAIETESNTAKIEFQSDDQNESEGFRLEWNAVPARAAILETTTSSLQKFTSEAELDWDGDLPDLTTTKSQVMPIRTCDEKSKERSGTISSPGYPDNYLQDTGCESVINVTKGHSIRIRFADLQIPIPNNKPGCQGGFVKFLVDGKSNHRPYCGSIKPDKTTLNATEVKVQFHANAAERHRGFKLIWKAVENSASDKSLPQTTISGTQHADSRTGNNLLPKWAIYACVGLGVLIACILIIFFIVRRRKQRSEKKPRKFHPGENGVRANGTFPPLSYQNGAAPYAAATDVLSGDPMYATVDDMASAVPKPRRIPLKRSDTDLSLRPRQPPPFQSRRMSATASMISNDSFDTLDSYDGITTKPLHLGPKEYSKVRKSKTVSPDSGVQIGAILQREPSPVFPQSIVNPNAIYYEASNAGSFGDGPMMNEVEESAAYSVPRGNGPMLNEVENTLASVYSLPMEEPQLATQGLEDSNAVEGTEGDTSERSGTDNKAESTDAEGAIEVDETVV